MSLRVGPGALYPTENTCFPLWFKGKEDYNQEQEQGGASSTPWCGQSALKLGPYTIMLIQPMWRVRDMYH